MQSKILFCSSFIDHAQTGAAIFAQLFLSWAEDRGISVDIISSEKSVRAYIPLVRNNRIYSRIPVLQNYHRSYIYYKTVQNQLAKNEYDFIFFNSVTESLHTSKLIKDIPVFAFQHDENFMNDYKKNPSLKRKIYRNAMRKHERSASQFLDKILTNSRFMKSQIETIYEIHPLKVGYTYFRPYDLEHGNDKVLEKTTKTQILFVKHDFERGGLQFLAEALRKIPDHQFYVKIIGVSSNAHKAVSTIMAGIQHEIISNRSRDEIIGDYNSCELFCVPSLSEALGLANMEAMFFEKPVVSFDIPVMRELNQNQQIMQLAKVGDSGDLALKIKLCLEGKESVSNQIRNAKSFVENQISQDLFYKNLDGFFFNC
ncbi:glycosyltransferase [Saprospiraceae bacterium]|nr:glycosyltransferase [Saprospiraceae bacterium]